MPSEPIILLDTPIAAGIFAIAKAGTHVETQKRIWKNAVFSLSSPISASPKFRIPTPVCYELMTMNKYWHNFISSSNDPAFVYSKCSITDNIWQTAARYSFETTCISMDDKEIKVKTLDPLIAAYCITGGYYLITTNQQDFPDSHFTVVKSEILVLPGKRGNYRAHIYLLQPRPMAPTN